MEPRRFDRFGLLAGLVFIVIGALFLLEALAIIDVPASVVLPVLFVALGVGLLFGRRPATQPATPWDETAPVEPLPGEEAPPVEPPPTPPPRDPEP